MEKRIEKWESLRLEAQSFAPQEYCDSCWIATVKCLGESSSQGQNLRYIHFPPDTHEYDLHWNGHSPHPVQYDLRIPDGVTEPSEGSDITQYTQYIISVFDPVYSVQTGDIEVAAGRSTNQHNHYDGWGWLVGTGDNARVHFTYDPTFTFDSAHPNHS